MRRHAKASIAGSTRGSGRRRGLYGLVCLCVLGLAAFLGSGAPSAAAAACPNEEFRQGPSGYLPDCRAYEMVSPPEKGGYEVTSHNAEPYIGPNASLDGGRAVWGIQGAFGEDIASSGAGNLYLSRRGATNWSSEGISPPLEAYNNIEQVFNEGFTEDLEKYLFYSGAEPPLTPEAAFDTPNLYLRENASGAFRLLSVGAPSEEEFAEWLAQGISEGASHVAFVAYNELTEDSAAAGFPYLYDWNAATGLPTLIGRAPGTNEVLPGTVTLGGPNYRHPVSADGSRIFFKGGGSGCGVCVRINGATTQIVSEGAATFQGASSDGSVAYVTKAGELERYDVATDELTPLTAGGEVQGVVGLSADGSRVYLVAKAELASGATAGMNNLYLWTEGAGFHFIATGNTSSAFTRNWSPATSFILTAIQELNSRVTPDGMHVAFTANNSLTGYPDEGKPEIYLYSAATDELVCASCNPSGEPATSGASIFGGNAIALQRPPRNLPDDGGRLFFNTAEALVPRDSNNLEDIYEYDSASGEVALITTGTGETSETAEGTGFGEPLSEFRDASANGDDVLLVTRQRLVPADQDELRDVYDARVDGGFAAQHPSQAVPCTGDACRGESSAPSLAGAASAGFVGKGNISSKQNCNKLGKEAKKLSKRSKRLRKNANKAKKAGNSSRARKLNKKANRLAKQARNKSKSAKKCRKRNRGASK